MIHKFFPRSEPGILKPLITGGAFFAFFGLMFTALGWAAASLFADLPSDNGELTASQLNGLRIIQTSYALGAFFVSGIATCIFTFPSLNHLVKIPKPAVLLIFAAAATFFMLPFTAALGALNEALPFPEILSGLKEKLMAGDAQSDQMMIQYIHADTALELIRNLILVAAVPAVAEEVFFRGFLQKTLGKRFSPTTAVWITALVFSLFHFHFSGFLPRLFLGALMGYLFLWSGSLLPAVIAHFVNNAAGVIAAYLYGAEFIINTEESMELTAGHFAGVIASFAVTLTLLLIYRKLTKLK